MSRRRGEPDGTLRPAVLCPGACCLFTSRRGGVSRPPFGTLNLSGSVGDDPAAVARNRCLVLEAVGAARPGAARQEPDAAGAGPRELAWMRQVHGATTAYVPGPARGAGRGDDDGGAGPLAPQADAAYTDSPAVALGVLVADCAPVLLADPAAGLVGAAHAGRAGLVAGVLDGLVTAMSSAGADPARMRAVIGPVICGSCYEVPGALRDEAAAAAPGSACLARSGTPGIDIAAGLRGQLARLGITAVRGGRRCPAESADLYSYRRDGVTGRFAGLVWLAPWPA